MSTGVSARRAGRWRALRGLFIEAGAVWRRHAFVIFVLLAAVTVTAWFAARSGYDRMALAEFTLHRERGWIKAAKVLTRWGELHLGPMLLLALLAVAGWLHRKKEWLAAALAGLMGTLVGGLGALTLKICIGRPRPHLGVPDVLHGFTMNYGYHSFPSGHSAHCWALVGAVVPLAPRWAMALAVPAAAVCWSRLYLERHYFSDVAGGMVFGLAVGAIFGLAARRRVRAGAWLGTEVAR
jgi:membrane-associated phospholipid phosphatase